jgi:hypothetical protein
MVGTLLELAHEVGLERAIDILQQEQERVKALLKAAGREPKPRLRLVKNAV